MSSDSLAEAVIAAFGHVGIDARWDGVAITLDRVGAPPLLVLSEPDLTDATGPAIAVADGLSRAERQRLDAAGTGWLDLSGHLRFVGGGVFVDADVPGVASLPSARVVNPLAGAVVAGASILALMAWPDPLPGVRAVARHLDATAGGVSLAVRRLVEAGLLTRDLRATSDLFWAVAEVWRPAWHDVPASAVSEAVAVGAEAAAVLGAPVAVVASASKEVLVATETDLKLTVLRGQQVGKATRVRVAVAPSPVALDDPTGHQVARRPVAAEAIVALTLAFDPGRGAESVRAWEGEHVW